MIASDNECSFELSRRKLLAAAGIAAAAASLSGSGQAEAALVVQPSADPATTPPVHGLHLQFGADASSEMVVSWHTLQPVRNPRVVLGRPDGSWRKASRPRRLATPMLSPARLSTPIMPSSVDCGPTSPISMGPCMTAPSRSLARSAP